MPFETQDTPHSRLDSVKETVGRVVDYATTTPALLAHVALYPFVKNVANTDPKVREGLGTLGHTMPQTFSPDSQSWDKTDETNPAILEARKRSVFFKAFVPLHRRLQNVGLIK